MLIIKLKYYEWRYANGVATLVDKRKDKTFELPIVYVMSFMRAGITFMRSFRKEQMEKERERRKLMKARFQESLLKSRRNWDKNVKIL